MASISLRLSSPSPAHLDPNPSKFSPKPRAFLSASNISPFKRSSASFCRCRCSGSGSQQVPSGEDGGDGGGGKRWDSVIQDVVKSAVKRWDDYVRSYRAAQSEGLGSVKNEREEESDHEEEKHEENWDWERWKQHFGDMEAQERIVSVLKVQLRDAVAREDYSDALKLKLAITAAAKSDTIRTALSDLGRAIEEERYEDAAFLRDHAGVGLVGWWAGISEDSAEPRGRIIHISAEHGKYVARSYNSRQLISARPGFPLFEIYFTLRDGKYKQQAVYLKRSSENSGGSAKKPLKMSDASNLDQSSSSTEEQKDTFSNGVKDTEEERDDDFDVADGLAGIQNVLRDMIPGVKVKVLKVVLPGKVDRDMIAKVIEQIMDEEDEGTDDELEGIEEDVRAESDIEIEEVETDAVDVTGDTVVEQNEISVKLVIGTMMQKLSTDMPHKDIIRVPARLEKKGRFSFLFSIEQDDKQREADGKKQALQKRAAALSAQQSYNAMSDLAKVFLSKEKVLKDVGELLSLTLKQSQNHQPLSGPTLFNRIEIPTTSDPLSGLYVGAHGMYMSEILHLKCKFGQWQDDDANVKNRGVEFYEYVEAHKLTGGLSVPAGQVAFRAKIGKHYQLPHKGIIPEELGVIARYKGQGRIADPGFQNPRWVDGELVILDGKYIRGGPVIGFVYWAPEYHFLVFFNRLRLPEYSSILH